MGNVSMDWQSYKMEGLVANGLDYETLRLVRIWEIWRRINLYMGAESKDVLSYDL